MDRKLLNKSSEELIRLFEAHKDDPKALFSLRYELTFRSAKSVENLDRTIISLLVNRFRESFRWPSTDVILGGGIFPEELYVADESPLKRMGYSTGYNGTDVGTRRDLLRRAYLEQLPSVESPEYMATWGPPRTAKRLHGIANFIASNARTAKRRENVDMSKAISDWERDLSFLKQEFYEGEYDFAWPGTNI